MTMTDDHFSWQGEHLGIQLPGARALFTSRRGGVSSGPYESLNLGRFTDDRPEDVERNRELVEREVGLTLTYGRQVHGAGVHVATAPENEPPEADGQVTARRDLAPMVLTADCLPVAVAGGGAVGMLHAGWRGLADGILEAGVAALRAVSSPGARLGAAIGPGAGPCCYEVSEDVHRRFAELGLAHRRGDALDLKAIAREKLESAGVVEVNDAGLCTICGEPSLFYSHRREGGVTGRQAGIAWLS